MNRARAHKLFSRLAWLTLCIGMLCIPLLPSFIMREQPFAMEKDAQSIALLKHWEVRYTSGPYADGIWRPFDESEWSRLSGYIGSLTVRRTLPELNLSQPYLFMGSMNRFEVLIDGETVYRVGMDDGLVWNNHRLTFHALKLNPEDAGKTITIRIKWDGLPFYQWDWMIVAEPETRLVALLQSEWLIYVISLLILTAGAVGGVLYVRRKLLLYMWFSVLAFSAGFGLLFECASLQWFVDVGSLYYWGDLLLPFSFYAFIGMYGEALGASNRLSIRLTKAALLLFTLVTMCLSVWSTSLHFTMFVNVFPIIGLATIAVVTYTLFMHRSEASQAGERQWLIRGYTIMTICGLLHILQLRPPGFVYWISELWPRTWQVLGSSLPSGLLLFLFSMIMVLVNNVRRVHRDSERNAKALAAKNTELAMFHRNLEQLVDIRTKELETAHRSLQLTLREKAETLAEMSVLEERTRIAHEMHDVVGHTLTAAIVQLEAAKKLAERDQAIPFDKLTTVNGLIRKGLDDIRRTVRMLTMDNHAPFKLEPAMRELIRETETTMEVQVDATIVVPTGLGNLAEQILYHALQEGLTNGIRHGQCSRFRFSLRPVDGNLRFSLWNDGLPYKETKPGFGLTAMIERIHLIGGTVSIGSSIDADGEPIGCELVITLPLRDQEEYVRRE